jgi:MGT family glycosyltransferase
VSRFLFVFPPLVGHVNPAVGVAEELTRRGHEVAWVAHQAAVGHLLGAGATIYPAGDEFLERSDDLMAGHDARQGAASLMFVWERFLVPLTVAMAAPVRAAFDAFGPDVVVADQHAFAGSIEAREAGIPWAVSASTTAELLDPLVVGATKIASWFERQLQTLYGAMDLPHLAEAGFDPRFSPHLVIQYSTARLVGTVQRNLSSVVFVGPAHRLVEGTRNGFPWEWLDRYDSLVLVSLGTLVEGKGLRFLARTMEAVADQRYGVVLVGDAFLLPAAPDNVLVRPYVPQLDLLPRMDAMISHGGQNSVLEALMAGVPLVCAPIRLDQPITADQVVRAGAGRRLSFARARPREIGAAIDAVLTDPSYRQAAAHVGESLRTAGGATAAADHLEGLVRASATKGSAPS